MAPTLYRRIETVSNSTTTAAPTATRKPRKKPERFARVLGKLFSGDLLVRIEERGPRSSIERRYCVRSIPSAWGQAFVWEKLGIDGGDVYHVNLGDDTTPATCECKGHLAHGHKTVCKHIACTRVLIAEGKLS
jgi:hypothetical protein